MYVSFNLKDALEKLRQRQKAELEETDTLLEELYNEDQKNDLEDEEVSSLALSILSGVDYGFRSRSEGAASGLAGGYAVDGIDTKGYVCACVVVWLFPLHLLCSSYTIYCKNLKPKIRNVRSTWKHHHAGLPAIHAKPVCNDWRIQRRGRYRYVSFSKSH